MMITQQKVRTTSLIQDQSLSLFEKLAIIIASSGLLVLSAKMMVPFWPVSLTFQPLAVITLGIVLGPRMALGATVAYLLEGTAGLPVFADSLSYPGLAMLTKPSAGFLISFPIAAFVAGVLAEKGWTSTWLKSTALFAVAYTIMYGMGVSWLAGLFGLEIAFQNMLLWIPGDLAKVGLGVASISLYNKMKS